MCAGNWSSPRLRATYSERPRDPDRRRRSNPQSPGRVLQPGSIGRFVSTSNLYAGYKPRIPTDHPTVSFELYPPRDLARSSAPWAGITKLIDAAPSYVSVTYGAAGRANTRDASVQVLLKVLDTRPDVPAVAHLTCLGYTEGEITLIVRLLIRAGIRDFLALRGDPPPNQPDFQPPRGAPQRAVDLVRIIRRIEREELTPNDVPVSIAVAAYPANTGAYRRNDVAALLEKQDAGADYAITQVFYDPDNYADEVDQLTAAGCRLPIVPGILPLHDFRRLTAMKRLAGISVPPHIQELHRIPDVAERSAATLAATFELAAGVLDRGAPGIHIYTFNQPRPSLDILEYLRANGYLGGAPSPSKADDRIDLELVSLALRQLTPNT